MENRQVKAHVRLHEWFDVAVSRVGRSLHPLQRRSERRQIAGVGSRRRQLGGRRLDDTADFGQRSEQRRAASAALLPG